MRQAVAVYRLPHRRSEVRRVYVREEGRMSYGLCRFHCRVAYCRSNEFVRQSERQSPLPLPLSSNGDLGGREK